MAFEQREGEQTGNYVVVTGDADFLDSIVAEKLPKGDWVSEVFVWRSRKCGLREKEAVIRMCEDARPDIVIHLVAAEGGIGANQANLGKFFSRQTHHCHPKHALR